jgi:small-conductance mechanosensitive channel
MQLDRVIWGNPLSTWLIAAAIALGVLLVLVVIRRIITSRIRSLSERTTNEYDDVLADVLDATKGFALLAGAMLAGSTWLELGDRATGWLGRIAVLLLIVQAGFWGAAAAHSVLHRYRRQKLDNDPSAASMVNVFSFVVYLAVWSGVVLMALDNLGFDITALIASLGIGGVAIALALQNVLGDLFASLAIVLDKPFVLGNFIAVGDLVGTVENIGLKTTRVRSISGEQLVFSNADLLSSRLRNFGRMLERRLVFTLGVTYQTPRDMLERIPTIIKAAIEDQPDTRFDRSHLSGYGDFSINFETVWYTLSSDYTQYMDRQQAIYLAIHKAFEAEGIEFAYPTQTVFLEKS